jgi:hypothetical protein
VERREGVRARTRPSTWKDTPKLGNGSVRRFDRKAITKTCNREECSQTTLCVNAEVSICMGVGLRPRASRSST